MRPPGPLADSKRVTETPFLASVDAHRAPETANIPFWLWILLILLFYKVCMFQSMEALETKK